MHDFFVALGHLLWHSLLGLVGGWMGTTLLALAVGAMNYFVGPWVDAPVCPGHEVLADAPESFLDSFWQPQSHEIAALFAQLRERTEKKSFRLRCPVSLVSAFAGRVVLDRNMSGYPTYQELACRCWGRLLVIKRFINNNQLWPSA